MEIRPKGFLPVKLIEGRIATDLINNLQALRAYVEKKVVPMEAGTPPVSAGEASEPSSPGVSIDAVSAVEASEPSSPGDSMVDAVVGAIRSYSDEDLQSQNKDLRARIRDLELELLAKDELIAKIETLLKKI